MGNRYINDISKDEILSLIPEHIGLLSIDQNSNLHDHLDVIQDAIEQRKSPTEIREDLERAVGFAEMYDVAQADYTYNLVEEMVDELFKCHHDEYDIDDVRDIVHHDYLPLINDEVLSRDTSCENYFCDLLRQTDQYGLTPLRVEVLFSSNSTENRYNNSRLGEVIDLLNLNPIKLKEALQDDTIYTNDVEDDFPNLTERNGHEYADYDKVVEEWLEDMNQSNSLVFLCNVSLSELYEKGFDIKELTIPKCNYCGLFSSSQGSGSMLDITLNRDYHIDVENNINVRLELDGWYYKPEHGYSIQETIGYADPVDVFGNKAKINQSPAISQEKSLDNKVEEKKRINLQPKRGNGGVKL